MSEGERMFEHVRKQQERLHRAFGRVGATANALGRTLDVGKTVGSAFAVKAGALSGARPGVDVGWLQRMDALAARAADGVPRFSAPYVVPPRSGFEMPRVHTCPRPTQMIKIETDGDRASMVYVNEAMGATLTIDFPAVDDSVAVATDGAPPNPAPTFIRFETPEQVFVGEVHWSSIPNGGQ